MTYRSYEDSVASGEPVELYDFYDVSGNHWRLNTSAENVVYGGFTYVADVIERTEITIGGGLERDQVEFTFPRDHAFATQFLTGYVDETTSVIVYRRHVDQYVAYWYGHMIALNFDDIARPTCVFESLISGTSRTGRRRRCQILCDHVLYSSGCGLSMSSYEASGLVASIGSSNLSITSTIFSAKSSGYYTGGVVKFGTVYRFVLDHTSDTVTIDRTFTDLLVGDTIYAYAGCDLTPSVCRSRFNNITNYGGQEFLPIDNPFQTGVEQNSLTTNPRGRLSRKA
jgi:hypothetical protein